MFAMGHKKRSPSGILAASNAMGNIISDIQLWITCVISQTDGKRSGAGDVMTR